MGNMKVHFSSKTDEWETPILFFKAIDKKYGPFAVDVCASPLNQKAKIFYTKEDNGLAQSWHGTCWMNPPYGRTIGLWVKKAYEESLKGAMIVCLLPARTDTRWFHDYCMKGKIEFIKGRLKFGNAINSAPFPSMLVVFGL